MLTEKEKDFVRAYIDPEHFEQEKVVDYLSLHETVGWEVFRCGEKEQKRTYLPWDKDSFNPIPVQDFVRRIPFYFYIPGKGACCDLILLWADESKNLGADVGKIFPVLEFMFYECHLPLKTIFDYLTGQTGNIIYDTLFFQWHHYLQLCKKTGCTDYTPDCFITAYNLMLERCSMPPIVYEVSPMQDSPNYCSIRQGRDISFQGVFPCDGDGNPVMRWIGLDVKEAESVTCNCRKMKIGTLTVKITPRTVIKVLNIYNRKGEEDIWWQVYAGPRRMSFNTLALKNRRNSLGYTQKQVADAIGSVVRTYQKWEGGDSTPDGYHLLRIMNWLDISDVQDLITYEE